MELWYTEKHTKDAGLTLRVKETLKVWISEYQTIEVLDTFEYGRVLLLDGLVMCTERDEFIYHELLVQPAMFSHPCPEQVLVIGGGDGGAVREVLKHNEVKSVVLCEIDKAVIETAREFLPTMSAAMFSDSRASIIIEDGISYLKQNQGKFDIIIIDSTDPVGPAKGLFKEEFYKLCLNGLRSNGIIAAQTESPFYHLDFIKNIKANLKNAGFHTISFYCGSVPTYPSGMWSWAVASCGLDPYSDFNLEKARSKAAKLELKYYTPEMHKGLFQLPKFVKDALA